MNARRIFYVTSNPNKLRETIEILGTDFFKLITNRSIDLPEYQGTIAEVAESKCRFAVEQVDGPVLVEDTGLCFDALNGLPGPYIKWFLKAVGPEGLHKMVLGFGEGKNTGEAVCTFALCEGRDQPVRLFQGVTRGTIVQPRGASGFGWDSCFLPDGHVKTYAEMDKVTKNSISHRFKATNLLCEYLREHPEFSKLLLADEQQS